MLVAAVARSLVPIQNIALNHLTFVHPGGSDTGRYQVFPD